MCWLVQVCWCVGVVRDGVRDGNVRWYGYVVIRVALSEHHSGKSVH